MNHNIQCECGHTNPEGTILCESCGKPLQEEENKTLLNMRYEGSARRSQVYQRTVIDKIWNYFSSVKVGVTLIILILIAAAIGTILPQDMYIPAGADPKTFYETTYGTFGKLYKMLGFDNLYGSWWFVVLLALLGTSIIIASFDRYIPLRRALKNQRVTRHENFMKRQRLFGKSNIEDHNKTISDTKDLLLAKRYHVREEDGNLFAEKGRFSRWGPYVNHIGLIIVLVAGMLRYVPGMYVNEKLWVREGQTVEVPGTHHQLYIKNHQFILQNYNKNDKKYKQALTSVKGPVAKNYQSNVTLYKVKGNPLPGQDPKLHKVNDYSIRVNHPLTYDHYSIFQVDYRQNVFSKMSFFLENKATNKKYGKLTVDLFNPKSHYQLQKGYHVTLMDYFPDFYFNKNGEPASKTDNPNNPAFIFKMFTPDKPEGEVDFVAIKTNLEPLGKNTFKMAFAGLNTLNISGFIIKRDFTLWIFFVGAMIFLIGVAQGMYWNHRRIWLRRKGEEIWLAGLANKNWISLKKDIQDIISKTELSEPIDQLEEKTFEKLRKEEI